MGFRGNLLRKNLSSVALRARDFIVFASGRSCCAEFVTNSTSTRGGAVSRPHGCILKTCPAFRKLIPCLAGLLKISCLAAGRERSRPGSGQSVRTGLSARTYF